ncbi:unnamed protein product [Blepharisma stoltei]|uniref:Uncharacterized protein n=1 Tax=Blepharisma stoltei TaxID=1481888 RepID=A0AAU9IV46_9CILI|nr:unnamed protein product [Blepharisma stoltei]
MKKAEYPDEEVFDIHTNRVTPEVSQFLQHTDGDHEKTKFISPKGDKSPSINWEGDSVTKRNSDERFIDFKNINIHPRFDSSLFEIYQKIETIKDAPIEYYESILYDLCRRFNVELFSNQLTTKCVEIFHHIYRLKSEECDLSTVELNQLNHHFEDVLNAHPKALQEYELFKDTLNLISALGIKWGVVNLNNFSYRLTGRSLNIKLLDLQELNSNVFTCEAIWIATMVKQEPFLRIADDQIVQLSLLLIQITTKLINSLLSLNQNIDFNNVASIAGLVTSKNPKAVKFTGIEPDFQADVVPYQRLKLKRGILSFCNKDQDLKAAREIKSLIEDFESVYRQFEQTLMINILIMSKNTKDVA